MSCGTGHGVGVRSDGRGRGVGRDRGREPETAKGEGEMRLAPFVGPSSVRLARSRAGASAPSRCFWEGAEEGGMPSMGWGLGAASPVGAGLPPGAAGACARGRAAGERPRRAMEALAGGRAAEAPEGGAATCARAPGAAAGRRELARCAQHADRTAGRTGPRRGRGRGRRGRRCGVVVVVGAGWWLAAGRPPGFRSRTRLAGGSASCRCSRRSRRSPACRRTRCRCRPRCRSRPASPAGHPRPGRRSVPPPGRRASRGGRVASWPRRATG